jgi:hypothetical protein
VWVAVFVGLAMKKTSSVKLTAFLWFCGASKVCGVPQQISGN